MITHFSQSLLTGLGLIGSLILAGCGTTSATVSTHSAPARSHPTTSVAPPTVSLGSWHVVGTIPAPDTEIGLQPESQHLWILVQTPATANHGTGYQGLAASLSGHTLHNLTPVLLPPGQRTLTSWNCTTHGTWWVVFVGHGLDGHRTIRTAVWQPGQTQWTLLPSLTVTAPHHGSTAPTVSVVTGRNGHAWLVSNYNSTMSTDVAQSVVYRLESAQWHKIYTFPLATDSVTMGIPQQWITWSTSGPTGTLYVSPEGPGNAVLLTNHGSIQQTLPLPSAILTWISNHTAFTPNIVMSRTDISYNITTDSLQQWHHTQSQSLISPGSLLAQGYTWQGFWHNAPVVSTTNTQGELVAYIYDHGQWHLASFLTRSESSSSSVAIAQWHSNTLWSLGSNGQTIWGKFLSNGSSF